MRLLIIITSFFISAPCFSQDIVRIQTVIVDSGKHEFKLQAQKDTADYSAAVRILTNQVKQDPRNAEYRYFLGYSIDRLNADNGGGIPLLKKEMTLRASEQFEAVTRLEPVYKGEIVILDPYAKLSSIWGSLAGAYLNRKLIDSAKWAFLEGRKRGGFMEPILEFNRQVLNSCEKNSILVTIGDNITIPIWYLQTIENYRTDVIVVDAGLLNTIWYPKYLKAEKDLRISFSNEVLDTIEYKKWQPQQVSVVNPNDARQIFSWELRPTYLDNYVLKGDRILLNIIQQNFYSKPIYFSIYSDSTYNLFLSPYFSDEGLVSRVVTKAFDYKTDIVNVSKNLYNYNIERLNRDDIAKSQDATIVLNSFRWAFYYNINRLVTQGNYSKARELTKIVTDKFGKDKLPFTSEETEEYMRDFFQKVGQDQR